VGYFHRECRHPSRRLRAATTQLAGKDAGAPGGGNALREPATEKNSIDWSRQVWSLGVL